MMLPENRYTPIGSEPKGMLFRIMLQALIKEEKKSCVSRLSAPEVSEEDSVRHWPWLARMSSSSHAARILPP
jgi:hypothetical protein